MFGPAMAKKMGPMLQQAVGRARAKRLAAQGTGAPPQQSAAPAAPAAPAAAPSTMNSGWRNANGMGSPHRLAGYADGGKVIDHKPNGKRC